MAAVQEDWKTQARELREAGLSEREIATSVGKANSTVHKFLKDAGIEPAAADDVIDVDVTEPDPDPHPDPNLSPFHEAQSRIAQGGDVEWESEGVYVERLRVDGSSQFALDLGGKLATAATLKISGKAEVDGFYRKGERVRFSGEAVITAVAVKDKLDKPTGIVMEAEESYAATIVDLRVG